MMSQNDILGVGATQVAIGLSTTIRINAGNFVQWYQLKYLSGGSLEVVPPATAAGWGTGYLLSTTEVVNFHGPATFYLCAKGATAVAQLMIGYTSGASLV